jgi:hypothetical protein
MNRAPGTLILLIGILVVLFFTGLSLLWQAVMDKSAPAKSKVHGFVNEIKFRVGFAAGMVSLILAIAGAIWLIVKW